MRTLDKYCTCIFNKVLLNKENSNRTI